MENLIYFLAFTVSILFLSKFLLHQRWRNLPPSPPALPVIGHLHLTTKPLHHSLEALLSQYGPILYLKLGWRRVLVISSPSAVEECFTKNDIILSNRPRTMSTDHFGYNYVNYAVAPYGHVWRTLRRAHVVEVFSPHSLQRLCSLREEEVTSLCKELFRVSRDGAKEVDLKYLSTLLVANIMLKVAAGKRGFERDAGEEMEKKFLDDLKKRFSSSIELNPCDFFPVLRLAGYGGYEKKVITLQRMRDEYLQNMVDDVRSKRLSSTRGDQKGSLIETLLSLQESEPDVYTNDAIKAVTSIMFNAGLETAPPTLEWAMSLLLLYPEVMHKFRAEINSTIGLNRLISESDLPNLPYLHCIINETLRLYPPAPLLLPRLSSEDFTLAGYNIPKGTMLFVNAWKMHRDGSLWENPLEFKPERFEGVSCEQEGFKFIPFGVGRRACPATAFGIRSVSLALSMLVQCFEWEKVREDIDMSQQFGMAMSKAKPLMAICRPCPSLVPVLSQL